jgi:HemK-like putative methylase
VSGREGWLAKPLRILDVGTGSGCLLLTLLCELPNAVGVGTDISEAALEVARNNARRLGVEHRAQWLDADALEDIGDRFDILVSNPPYVRSERHCRPRARGSLLRSVVGARRRGRRLALSFAVLPREFRA